MPAPLAAAAIAGGISLAQGGINAASQGKMNKATRNWNTEMYGRQRQDALFDWMVQNQYNEQQWKKQNEYNEGLWNKQNEYNERLWRMQNQYDSPAEQMRRYKEAGLNPNLIYGNSSSGGSIQTAQFNEAPLRTDSKGSVNAMSYNPRAPQFDLQNGLLSFNAMRESAARVNNMEAQNKILEQDVILRSLQAANIAGRTAKDSFELGLASDLRKTSVQAAEASLRKMQVDTDIALHRNEREAAMNSSNLREAAERIAMMRGQTLATETKRKLDQLDLDMRSLGIEKTDNMIFRILGRIFSQEPVQQGLKRGLDWFSKPQVEQAVDMSNYYQHNNYWNKKK